MEVFLPSLDDQQEIIKILDNLNDKINFNEKKKESLEDISFALFNSWFSNFDPVKENIKGEKNGLFKNLNHLFPSSFKDTELSSIPSGWKIELLKDVIEKYIDNRGKTPPTIKNGIPLVEVKHINENSQFPNLKTDKYISKETFDNWFRQHVKKYDILISTVGTIGFTSIVFDTSFVIAQNILGFRTSNKSLSIYLFYLIKSRYFQYQMDSRLIETVQKSIKRKDLDDIPIIIPPVKLINKFSEIVENFLIKQFHLEKQNTILSNLLRILLPRLISGKLKFYDMKDSLVVNN